MVFVLDIRYFSVLQRIRLMFSYKSDERVKLIRHYYCNSVTAVLPMMVLSFEKDDGSQGVRRNERC